MPVVAERDFVGATLWPEIVRNAVLMPAATYSMLCREAYLGKPTNSNSVVVSADLWVRRNASFTIRQ